MALSALWTPDVQRAVPAWLQGCRALTPIWDPAGSNAGPSTSALLHPRFSGEALGSAPFKHTPWPGRAPLWAAGPRGPARLPSRPGRPAASTAGGASRWHSAQPRLQLPSFPMSLLWLILPTDYCAALHEPDQAKPCAGGLACCSTCLLIVCMCGLSGAYSPPEPSGLALGPRTAITRCSPLSKEAGASQLGQTWCARSHLVRPRMCDSDVLSSALGTQWLEPSTCTVPSHIYPPTHQSSSQPIVILLHGYQLGRGSLPLIKHFLSGSYVHGP